MLPWEISEKRTLRNIVSRVSRNQVSVSQTMVGNVVGNVVGNMGGGQGWQQQNL